MVIYDEKIVKQFVKIFENVATQYIQVLENSVVCGTFNSSDFENVSIEFGKFNIYIGFNVSSPKTDIENRISANRDETSEIQMIIRDRHSDKIVGEFIIGTQPKKHGFSQFPEDEANQVYFNDIVYIVNNSLKSTIFIDDIDTKFKVYKLIKYFENAWRTSVSKSILSQLFEIS